jgi:sugar/nucleoside kinase (ribokinase family)
MQMAELDVVGIGNAIVDIIAHADDGFLDRHAMQKGGMTLIDEARAEALYAAMGPAMQLSGGSAGNTIAGIASFGGQAGYIGKVKDDLLGRVFRHDITSAGVKFPTAPAPDGPATARCLIFVTPDAQRTMNTYLGACASLSPTDMDEELIRAAKITYLEGYLYDPPLAQEAFHRAAEIAHEAGRKVALSLSDRFCVERYRHEFRRLAALHVDYLFANESEITALFETDFDSALSQAAGAVEIAAVTRGPAGSLIATGSSRIKIDAAPVARVVDTTGAGDLFASGFLFGLSRGMPLAECGRLASLAAAEIISHYGGRPETPLKDYLAANGGGA